MQQTDTILRTDRFGLGTCNITADAFSHGRFPCRSFRNDFIQNIFEQMFLKYHTGKEEKEKGILMSQRDQMELKLLWVDKKTDTFKNELHQGSLSIIFLICLICLKVFVKCSMRFFFLGGGRGGGVKKEWSQKWLF